MFAGQRIPAHHTTREGEHMSSHISRRAFLSVTAGTLTGLALADLWPDAAYATDAYDTLRAAWSDYLTGGTGFNTGDPNVAAALTTINNNAQSWWSSLNTAPGRTYLWSDLTSTTASAQVTSAYSRLYAMALGFATYGSTYLGNASLAADIAGALDWMYTNRYGPTRSEYDNWWDWEIGSPVLLNNTMVLMYGQLTSTQISNYLTAIDHFVPDPNKMINGTTTSTGANRADLAKVVILRGILGKNSAKITAGQQALSDVAGAGKNSLFITVSSGDGFYADASFIQHTHYAYTGSYGNVLLGDLANLLALLAGSSWAVTDPNTANVYGWVYSAFEPLVFQGAMMAMVRGRAISRSAETDHSVGHSTLSGILRLIPTSSAADAATFKTIVKAWIAADTFASYYAGALISNILAAEAIVADGSVGLRPIPVGHIQYPNMYRVAHRRPTFAYAISMSNATIANYESINGENLKGWYTGDGMTYLYPAGDLGQYDHDFWATVNPYRLPGTTVDTQTRTNSSGAGYLSTSNWRQGAVLPGTSLGVTGLNLVPYNTTLRAKKTCVCLNDMIVALGGVITASSGRTIETIVDNRRISDANTETWIVGGVTEPTTLPWSATINGVTWANLSGTGGYHFPGGATLNFLREARTGAWSDINTGGSTTPVTRNYATTWIDHGVNPSNKTYAYVVFPGQSATDTAAYAANPTVTVLRNDGTAQAIKETTTGVWAGNFWAAGTADIVTSGSTSVSIIFQQLAGQLTLCVSDPTLKQTQLSITINIPGYHTVVQADPHITVTQINPKIVFTVDVSSQKTGYYTATFSQ
jgi:hyaluronate lyase